MTTPIDAKELIWTEKYNCHSAKVASFILNVNWVDGGGYEVRVNDTRLTSRTEDLETSKRAAIRLAIRMAREVLVALDEDTN